MAKKKQVEKVLLNTINEVLELKSSPVEDSIITTKEDGVLCKRKVTDVNDDLLISTANHYQERAKTFSLKAEKFYDLFEITRQELEYRNITIEELV